jgi:hypothetical protein
MSTPVNIKLGRPAVRGIDPDASGLMNIDVPLEPRPPDEWLQAFGGAPGPIWPVSMHAPSLSGNTVHLRPPDDAVDQYLNALQELVDATNAYYDREIAPALERQRQRDEDAEAERQRRIEEAQRHLDERA